LKLIASRGGPEALPRGAARLQQTPSQQGGGPGQRGRKVTWLL